VETEAENENLVKRVENSEGLLRKLHSILTEEMSVVKARGVILI